MSRKTKNNHPAGQTSCISATVDFTVVFGSVVMVNGTKDARRPKIVSGDSAAAGHGGVRVPSSPVTPGEDPGSMSPSSPVTPGEDPGSMSIG